LITATTLVFFAALSACTSDEDTPLGSEFIGDILGSTPGEVFQDTIMIASGDTVYSFGSLIENSAILDLGSLSGYERFIILKADFSSPGTDTSRIVEEANLRILVEDGTETRDIQALFYRLGTEYTEGDTVSTLDTLDVIADPVTGARVRTMALVTPTYPLPVDLVQGWIRGDSTHNGMAIAFTQLVDEKVIGFSSSESGNPPSIQVNFTDGTSTTYRINHDGNLVRSTQTTPNLIISDGFVRRVYFPIDLSQVNDSAAVHFAVAKFNIVPGTVFGSNQTVTLYVPDSKDPGDSAFLSGQLITQLTLDAGSGILEIPLTNILLLILAESVPDNGFVLHFLTENSEIKQAEFYSSANDSLRPRVIMTYSTPADFDE
jgi:hypothetical protein